MNEVVVLLDVGAEQRLLGLGVLDNDEIPRLAVGAGHGPTSDFENLRDVFVRKGIRLELSYAGARLHEIEQDLVITREVALIHTSSLVRQGRDRFVQRAAQEAKLSRIPQDHQSTRLRSGPARLEGLWLRSAARGWTSPMPSARDVSPLPS